jgi:hypothetical protein
MREAGQIFLSACLKRREGFEVLRYHGREQAVSPGFVSDVCARNPANCPRQSIRSFQQLGRPCLHGLRFADRQAPGMRQDWFRIGTSVSRVSTASHPAYPGDLGRV